MRVFILGLALLAAACSVEAGKRHHGGGYSVDIRANGNDQVYMVTAPDGRTTAARVHDGASAMLNTQEMQQALASMPTPTPPANTGDNNVSIRAPGFSLHASGDGHDDDDGATTTPASGEKPAAGPSSDQHDRGTVQMNIGGFGVDVNADDGGPGDADDRAQVRLTGLSAHDARKFITDADDLSPAVQSQMLTALGLSDGE
jgi:hypothetical protein